MPTDSVEPKLGRSWTVAKASPGSSLLPPFTSDDAKCAPEASERGQQGRRVACCFSLKRFASFGAGERDVDAARTGRADEHRLLTGVADATRGRRYAVIGHESRGGAHAPRPVEHLEWARSLARHRLRGRSRFGRLRHGETR